MRAIAWIVGVSGSERQERGAQGYRIEAEGDPSVTGVDTWNL